MNSSGYQHQHDYDPSQTISDDQSSEPYYAYNYQYENQPQFQQQQEEPTSVHPLGIPIAPEPSHIQQVNPVAGSLNPAAAAVVAGALIRLVGNVDGVLREPIGSSQYRGRGRRGGWPFRGSGRGRFNPHGRGRGCCGDGRQFSSHSSGPSISIEADLPAASGANSVMQPSSVCEQSPLPNPAQVPSAPSQTPPCKLWCEICKAECNTPEMLEQHNNGKRHRKNLLVHEELQRRKATNGQQSENVSTSRMNLTIQPNKVQESEEKGLPEENVGSEVAVDNHNDDTELQNIEGVSEVQAEKPLEEPADNSAVQGHAFKRKMRGGRGGKYMRSNDGLRKPAEPSKPKQVTSFICELCNVKCDSLVVYNSHLTGKKHLSNLKRVYGHHALNGEAGIQPLHPPDINALSNSNNFPVPEGVSVQQAVSDPHVLLAQLLMTVLSRVVPAAAPLSGPAALTSVAGSSHEPLSQNLSKTQVSDAIANFESQNPTGDTNNQVSSVPQQLDAITGSCNYSNTETADTKPATKDMVVKLPQDSSVMSPAENPVAENKQLPS